MSGRGKQVPILRRHMQPPCHCCMPYCSCSHRGHASGGWLRPGHGLDREHDSHRAASTCKCEAQHDGSNGPICGCGAVTLRCGVCVWAQSVDLGVLVSAA
jgi:hypothetical protein